MGTAKMLAAQLEVPTDLDDALALLERPNEVRFIDGMDIDGSFHLLRAGVGVSAKTVHDLRVHGSLVSSIRSSEFYKDWGAGQSRSTGGRR
jgi:diacylglycerol kinase family enzyme